MKKKHGCLIQRPGIEISNLINIHSLVWRVIKTFNNKMNYQMLARWVTKKNFCTITSALKTEFSNFLTFVIDLAAIRKILENETGGATCPSCKMLFDKGKKRKLIDTCGHDRCYSCMFKNESCTVCADTQRHQRQETQHEASTGKLNDTKKKNSLQFLSREFLML